MATDENTGTTQRPASPVSLDDYAVMIPLGVIGMIENIELRVAHLYSATALMGQAYERPEGDRTLANAFNHIATSLEDINHRLADALMASRKREG